jgi:hypothetical protein
MENNQLSSFAPASPDEFVAWLKANDACADAVAWVGKRSALEALAALEPTTQHIKWSCWMADRILPDEARRLRAALLRTMPERLVALPTVAGVIRALEADPFDAARLAEAGDAACAAWWTVWTPRRARAAESAVWAAMTATTAARAAETAAEAARAAGVDAEDVLRQQLAVVKEALGDQARLATARRTREAAWLDTAAEGL